MVLSALLFGLVASSALVIGAVVGANWTPPRLVLASALAFASGAWAAFATAAGFLLSFLIAEI